MVVLDEGEEVMEALKRLAQVEDLGASRFTAIGAFSRATLGYFEIDEKAYRRIPVVEQTKVLALVSDVTRHEGEVQVHAHVVLGTRDGTTRGGHLLEARVRPTLEVMLEEAPGTIQRRLDPRFGIPLIAVDERQ